MWARFGWRVLAVTSMLAGWACLSPSSELEMGAGGKVVLRPRLDPPGDGSVADSGEPDGGTDGGAQDGGTRDGGAQDSGWDAGRDAGTDGGKPDASVPDAGQNAFFKLLDDLKAAPTSSRQAMVNQFISQKGPVFPYVENDIVSFVLLNSTAQNVSLAGDLTCWSSAPEPLTRVAGTDLWHVSYQMPRDARTDYKLIVDGSWIFDPLNPRRAPGGFGDNSEVPMPDWVYPTEIDYRSSIPHGNVVAHNQFYSTALGNRRDIKVYTPPGYPSAAPYSSFYVNDGQEYLDLAKMQNVLDYLIWQGRMKPIVVIFVPPVNRSDEYVGAKIPQYEQFIATELVPFIEANYSIANDPLRRGMMGTSNGGYITMRIGSDYPQLFRRLGGQSSAIAADGNVLINKYASTTPNGQRIYASTGTLCDFYQANQSFKTALINGGYTYKFRVFNEGHSWGAWRGELDELLTFLFPP